MKHFGRSISSVLACGAAVLALVTGNTLQAQQQATAKVRAIRGKAEVSMNNSDFIPLKVNDTLKAGATIRTGPESTVDLFLNQSVVRVTADTTMGFDKLLVTDTGSEKVTETQLNLRSGKILGQVKKLAAASRYEIKTPIGVAGIRGTDYMVSVVPMGDGRYRLTVTSITGTVVGSAIIDSKVYTAVLNTGESWSPPDVPMTLTEEQLRVLRNELGDAFVLPPAETTPSPDPIQYDSPNPSSPSSPSNP